MWIPEDETVHDFGEIARGDELTCEVHVLNVGDAPLRIVQAAPDACWIQAIMEDERIEPRGQSSVRITVLTGALGESLDNVVHIESAHPEHQSTDVRLLGKVKTYVRAAPSGFWFNDVSPVEGAVQSIRVEDNTKTELTAARSKGEFFVASLERLGRSNLYDLTVRLASELTVGRHEGHVELKTSSGKRGQSIPIVACVTPPVRVVPPALTHRDGVLEHSIWVSIRQDVLPRTIRVSVSNQAIEAAFDRAPGERNGHIRLTYPPDFVPPREDATVTVEASGIEPIIVPIHFEPAPS